MTSTLYSADSVRNSAMHYLLGRSIAGLAGFATVFLLVRYMDVQNYAGYTVLTGLAMLSGVIAGLGLERAIARYVPAGQMQHSVAALGKLIWGTALIRLIMSSLIALLIFVLWRQITEILDYVDLDSFPLSLVFLLLAENLFQHFSSVFQALMLQKMLTRLLVIQWAGRLLPILALVVDHSSITLEQSLWIVAAPESLGVMAFIVVLHRHLKKLSHQKMTGEQIETTPWPPWKQVMSMAMHNYGFSLLAMPPQGYFMRMLVAVTLPIEIVAAYGFFQNVAEKARQYIPLHFFYGLLEPVMIASYLKDRNFSELSYRCQLLYKSNLLLMVPAIAWVAVSGDSIVGLMTGGKFLGLSWILLLVIVQLVIGSHVVLLQLMLNALEKSQLLIKASLHALPIMLIAMVVAVGTDPIYLFYGPILFSLVMNFYILYQLARDRHAYQPSWQMLWSILLSGVASFALVAFGVHALAWQPSAIVMTITTLAGVMLVYGAALWIMKAITLSEIVAVKALIAGKQRSNIKAHIWKLKFHYQIAVSGQQPRLFYLMGLGDKFPNLGDQAQAAAISIWLMRHFDMPVIELKNYAIETCLPILKKQIKTDDIVFLHSGGNFGDDWYATQQDRESVISSLGSNKIVQLPQTIFYGDTDSGHVALSHSQKIINAHPALLIFGRDFHSAEIAKKLFHNARVFARPDMVLSLQDAVERELGQAIARRCGRFKKILLIMRNDKESVYDLEVKQGIASTLSQFGYEAHLWDTNVNDIFPDQAKCNALFKYLKFISEFDAVVTDRYHGLIFSVLVKRPCVVLKTHNHKLTSAFDWFGEVNFVKRIASTDALITTIHALQNLQAYISPNWNTLHFDPMATEVKKFLEPTQEANWGLSQSLSS